MSNEVGGLTKRETAYLRSISAPRELSDAKIGIPAVVELLIRADTSVMVPPIALYVTS